MNGVATEIAKEIDEYPNIIRAGPPPTMQQFVAIVSTIVLIRKQCTRCLPQSIPVGYRV